MASKRYSISEARTHFARLIREAEAGERIELIRRGKPVALLLARSEPEPLPTRERSFWEAYEAFRRHYTNSDVGIDSVFEDVRDTSPGRDFCWPD